MTTQALKDLAANLSIPFPAAEAITNAVHLERAVEIQTIHQEWEQKLTAAQAQADTEKETALKALTDKAEFDQAQSAKAINTLSQALTDLKAQHQTELQRWQEIFDSTATELRTQISELTAELSDTTAALSAKTKEHDAYTAAAETAARQALAIIKDPAIDPEATVAQVEAITTQVLATPEEKRVNALKAEIARLQSQLPS